MDYSVKLKNFLDKEGKLSSFPSKRKMKIIALFFVASKFEKGTSYTEKEVNAIINGLTAFCDPATIRRELCNNKFLNRDSDGSRYWLEEAEPTFDDIDLN